MCLVSVVCRQMEVSATGRSLTQRAIIATSRKPTLLVSYMESYLNDLQRSLSEWRIAINLLASELVFFNFSTTCI